MSCPRLFEVEALRDGRISGAERASFERHLDSCAECTKERDSLEALAAKVREADDVPVDELRAGRERRRLLTAFEGGLTRPHRRRWPWLVAPALALVAVGAFYMRPPPAPAPVASPPSVVVRSEPAAGEVAFTQRQEPAREVVDLKSGTLHIAVDHALHPKPLVITLPDGELEDIGTVFTITVRSGATSEVHVHEGSVVLHLRASREPIHLTAGQSWTPPRAPDPEPAVSASTPVRAAPRAAASVDPAGEYRAALALFDAGDYPAAAPKLARFAAAHPDHVHGEDAAYLRVIALQRTGDADAMRAAAADYLRAYPNGFRHRDVERLTTAAGTTP